MELLAATPVTKSRPAAVLPSLLSLLALGLSACGGGGGGSNTTSSVGVLSDSPVAGVEYVTQPAGKAGVTNAAGEYEYAEGDTVSFTVAGLALPPVTATGRITPQTIAEEVFSEAGSDVVWQAALNLAILFQALDNDGDPSNGITLSENTTLSDNVTVDSLSESSPQDFATELTSESLPANAVIPSPADALKHFYKTELAGNWRAAGGSNDSDIVMAIDGTGKVLWVEYDVDGTPAQCSPFNDGYSALYTGALDFSEADLSVAFASSGRALVTGCAAGSTDTVAEMFDGEISLQGTQLVITQQGGSRSVTFDRFNNVKGSPVGVWQEGGEITDDGSLDFGADIEKGFTIFTDDRLTTVVLDRAAGSTNCEYNGVYVSGYGFDAQKRIISYGDEYLNHIWTNPGSCGKTVPANDWIIPVSASLRNDSVWEAESEELALMRNLSTDERTREFSSTGD